MVGLPHLFLDLWGRNRSSDPWRTAEINATLKDQKMQDSFPIPHLHPTLVPVINTQIPEEDSRLSQTQTSRNAVCSCCARCSIFSRED